MVVVCKVEICPYRSKSGFCRNRLLKITDNGFCGHIYNNYGQQNRGWKDPIEDIWMDGYKPQEKERLEDKKNVGIG